MKTPEHKMKIETGQLAGQLGWWVFVDGKLDCDIEQAQTEFEAERLAMLAYPGLDIITTKHPEHYSNESKLR